MDCNTARLAVTENRQEIRISVSTWTEGVSSHANEASSLWMEERAAWVAVRSGGYSGASSVEACGFLKWAT
jgi:hypothetical protein